MAFGVTSTLSAAWPLLYSRKTEGPDIARSLASRGAVRRRIDRDEPRTLLAFHRPARLPCCARGGTPASATPGRHFLAGFVRATGADEPATRAAQSPCAARRGPVSRRRARHTDVARVANVPRRRVRVPPGATASAAGARGRRPARDARAWNSGGRGVSRRSAAWDVRRLGPCGARRAAPPVCRTLRSAGGRLARPGRPQESC